MAGFAQKSDSCAEGSFSISWLAMRAQMIHWGSTPMVAQDVVSG